MISPSQRPLPDITQHPQQANIHARSGIRTHDRSRRAAVDLRLRPRGHWARLIRGLLLVIPFLQIAFCWVIPRLDCFRRFICFEVEVFGIIELPLFFLI